MHHVPVTISRDVARELYRAYQKHLQSSTPMDREVMSAYQKLAQGKLVIKALESITTAGVNDKGLPKLAIGRADHSICHLTMYGDGSASMSTAPRASSRRNAVSTVRFTFPKDTFPAKAWRTYEAIVPQPPLHKRPKHALQNYHVLFEADWNRAPPVDPFLIRRLGKGDLWLVLAMWDLTPVEQAVLSSRM
jgi:hypothetical protein